ncbi:hypothetical protein DPMN_095144 [Dreissena polymorpha]|uniref:Uncharacterized protein n=1 Tax=Dreissena polymorpha TaxID=45954 RepID=A0A9D4R2G6_DREPO|nr:hypothetical protein DPMN_095144 [Dreissena polymorpha]
MAVGHPGVCGDPARSRVVPGKRSVSGSARTRNQRTEAQTVQGIRRTCRIAP